MGRRFASRALVAAVVAAALSSVAGAVRPAAVSASDLAAVSAVRAGSAGIDDARAYLYRMMDLHATGSTPRLVQSFLGGWLGRHHFTDSETYDDALIIDALLADGTSQSLARARTIAQGLMFVQQHDAAADGRIRVAYAPDPLTSPNAIKITDRTSDVGNMAWVAMALVGLAAATNDPDYLTSAERIATWVVQHCRDTRGAGGFTGGYSASGRKIKWKSTEHNIDLYALYRMLAQQTGEGRWAADASWARRFVVAMWRANVQNFAVGTDTDGRTRNLTEQAEDVNTWSYLALRDPAYAASIDWDVTTLSTSGPGFAGVSFCAGDTTGAWYEGTAHVADALEVRGADGDSAQAAQYLADIRTAQRRGPNADGQGIIAASKNRLSDCDGDFYYSSLHTGATAWYVLAALGVDPFVSSSAG